MRPWWSTVQPWFFSFPISRTSIAGPFRASMLAVGYGSGGPGSAAQLFCTVFFVLAGNVSLGEMGWVGWGEEATKRRSDGATKGEEKGNGDRASGMGRGWGGMGRSTLPASVGGLSKRVPTPT